MGNPTPLRELFEEAFDAWYDAACSEDYGERERLLNDATKVQVRAIAALNDSVQEVIHLRAELERKNRALAIREAEIDMRRKEVNFIRTGLQCVLDLSSEASDTEILAAVARARDAEVEQNIAATKKEGIFKL